MIDEKTKEKLKRILVSIAVADPSEAIAVAKGEGNVKMSKDLSRAISSMRVKSDKGSVDIDIKLLDKLKAIELYFKLCSDGVEIGDADSCLLVEYDYAAPKKHDEE